METLMEDNRQYQDENQKLQETLDRVRLQYDEALRNMSIDEKRKDLSVPFAGKDQTFNKISLNYSEDDLNIPKIAELETEVERKIEENYNLAKKKN